MVCWFLICFVLNYPNKQVLSCVYLNNSPAAVENTLVYYIKELKFKKELKNSRTVDRGRYTITCYRQSLQLLCGNKSHRVKGTIKSFLSFMNSKCLSEHPTISEQIEI